MMTTREKKLYIYQKIKELQLALLGLNGHELEKIGLHNLDASTEEALMCMLTHAKQERHE